MRRRLAFTLLLSTTAFLLVCTGASAKLVAFQTVDHKVGCIMDGDGVRCDAKKPKFDPGPPPADCDLDWGGGVFVGRHDPADFVCAGDTALTRGAEELRWQGHKKIKAGRFHCKALDNFTIKCRNKRNKNGFVISRYEVHFLDSSGVVTN